MTRRQIYEQALTLAKEEMREIERLAIPPMNHDRRRLKILIEVLEALIK